MLPLVVFQRGRPVVGCQQKIAQHAYIPEDQAGAVSTAGIGRPGDVADERHPWRSNPGGKGIAVRKETERPDLARLREHVAGKPGADILEQRIERSG